MSSKHKGGSVYINVQNEPCIIMGIASITPRIDYYQGNEWFNELKTVRDFHVPGMDGLGWQELITENMAFWDTVRDNVTGEEKFSAGKQPSWLNYMTSKNQIYGNFADERSEMFMTLARRYQFLYQGEGSAIQDLTTYIDPSAYNYAFAETDLTAMNFWVQIASDITARRKMSAKQIPNL